MIFLAKSLKALKVFSSKAPCKRLKRHLCSFGAFFSYVDKTRKVGGTGNVNGIHRFYLKTVKKYVNRG